MGDVDLQRIEQFVREHPARRILGVGENEVERAESAFRFVNTVACDLRTQLGVNAGLYKLGDGHSVGVLALRATDDTVEIHLIVDLPMHAEACVTFGDGEYVDLKWYADPDANLGYIVTAATPTSDPRDAQAVPAPAPEIDLVAVLLDIHAYAERTHALLSEALPAIGASLVSIDTRLAALSPPPAYTAEGKFFNQTIRFTLVPKDRA